MNELRILGWVIFALLLLIVLAAIPFAARGLDRWYRGL